MDSNTLTLAAPFIWAILWIVIPDKVLAQRPTLKSAFFAIGLVLGAAALFILLTQHN